MIKRYRESFNLRFTDELYDEFLDRLSDGYPRIPFRLAETPVFIPKYLTAQLIAAGEEIISLIKSPDFKEKTQRAIPAEWSVPDENDHPDFLTFDFGICRDAQGRLTPKLIEMQGFPSLYGFQAHLGAHYKETFDIDQYSDVTPYFNGLDEGQYLSLLKKVIVGDHEPHEVVVMDVDALNQKTAIDFLVTCEYLGIKVLSLEDIRRKGDSLFYSDNGKEIKLKRIYNRLIFDEVADNKDVFIKGFDPREKLDIEWITHPNWFYRISKFTLPFLQSEFVPETFFVDQLASIPEDLENYVLKPLFSFAGMGVVIDVTKADIKSLKDPQNWILQRKVTYDPVVVSPDGSGIKVEIRLMYLWPDGEEPQLCINLARLSRGKMIGVRYNKDFDWVGGSIGLLER